MYNIPTYIIIVGLVILVLFIPWYIGQLGRFFASGIIEYFKERMHFEIKKEGEANGEEKKR